MVINITSPKAMVEFSGKKIKSQRSSKTLLTQIYIRLKGQGKFSSITNHAKTLCKECETKSLTIQALGQMFLGNVYSPNVVAKYVMFLRAQKS